MAQYSYNDLLQGDKDISKKIIALIQKYNLAIDNDYASYHKLTINKDISVDAQRKTFNYKKGDILLYVKIKNGMPTNIPKIFGMYNKEYVLKDSEIKMICHWVLDKSAIAKVLENSDDVELTPPLSPLVKRAENEEYKSDLITSIQQIVSRYAKDQGYEPLINKNRIKNDLSRYDDIKNLESELTKIKIYNADSFQVETHKAIMDKIAILKDYYTTDFEILSQLQQIASNAKREGILNQIKITNQDLEDNNIKLHSLSVLELDSYITQTKELLELYQRKYNEALEVLKQNNSSYTSNKTDEQIEEEASVPTEINNKIISYDNLPDDIKNLKQYVLYSNKISNGKTVKTIIDANTGWYASLNDTTTWVDLSTAQSSIESLKEKGIEAQGIGLVLTNGLMGIDINNIYDSSKNIKSEAKTLINKFNSYTEYSPNKNGVHILVYGKQPTAKTSLGDVRWFSNDAFLAITGDVYEKSNSKITPNSIAQPIIDKYYSDYMSTNKKNLEPLNKYDFGLSKLPFISEFRTEGLTTNPSEQNAYGYNDTDIIAELRMKASLSDFEDKFQSFYPKYEDELLYEEYLKNGDIRKFKHLWMTKNKLWTEFYTEDKDSWDIAVKDFLLMLRIFTDDKNQMDRIFRKSYLMKFKFDEYYGEKTYGQDLIEQIIRRYESPIAKGR